MDNEKLTQIKQQMESGRKRIAIDKAREMLDSQGFRLDRQRYSTRPFVEYLKMIEPPELAAKYVAFYEAHPAHKTVPAGAKHHHWWVGGLEDHLREMIGIGLDLMDMYSGDFHFTKSDLIITIFLHDFAKVWTYRPITADDRARNPRKFLEKQVFTFQEGTPLVDDESRTLLALSAAAITPTEMQWSAVLFAEGGFSDGHFRFGGTTKLGDYINAKNPLAAFVHVCDIYSSQLLGRSIYPW